MVDEMDVGTLIVAALKFIFPAYCANATPVLAGGRRSMDFGKNFFDGKRIFGKNKTFRGFFFGWVIGIIVGLAEGVVFGFGAFSILFSILTPLGALLGDLTGAFLKRRLNIAPGGLRFSPKAGYGKAPGTHPGISPYYLHSAPERRRGKSTLLPD